MKSMFLTGFAVNGTQLVQENKIPEFGEYAN
jgi:hypothetical protein